jgi:hypothetical protein
MTSSSIVLRDPPPAEGAFFSFLPLVEDPPQVQTGEDSPYYSAPPLGGEVKRGGEQIVMFR